MKNTVKLEICPLCRKKTLKKVIKRAFHSDKNMTKTTYWQMICQNIKCQYHSRLKNKKHN